MIHIFLSCYLASSYVLSHLKVLNKYCNWIFFYLILVHWSYIYSRVLLQWLWVPIWIYGYLESKQKITIREYKKLIDLYQPFFFCLEFPRLSFQNGERSDEEGLGLSHGLQHHGVRISKGGANVFFGVWEACMFWYGRQESTTYSYIRTVAAQLAATPYGCIWCWRWWSECLRERDYRRNSIRIIQWCVPRISYWRNKEWWCISGGGRGRGECSVKQIYLCCVVTLVMSLAHVHQTGWCQVLNFRYYFRFSPSMRFFLEFLFLLSQY